MTEQHDNTSNTGLASTETDESPVAGVETPGDAQNGSEGSRSSKEARYRVERNEARAERDALSQRIERLQRAEIERLASDALSHPADLFSLSGNGIADYLTESGDVDPEKVAADVAAIVAERPGLRRTAPAVDPSQGHGGAPPKQSPTFADLMGTESIHY